jgi:hypothetical protein
MEKSEKEIDERLKGIETKKAEVELKRLELEKREGKKVHAFYFDTPDFGSVVGFVKEPALFVKMQSVDMAQRGSKTSAAQIILDVCLMKEESDARIYTEDPTGKFDDIKMGANFAAQGIITYCVDLLKKN